MTSTPAIRIYLREIGAYEPLTADDEIELAKRIEAGCEDARALLIKHSLGLVVSIARGFDVPTLPMEDLISEGTIGLMRAAERYDWRRGARFGAAARPWIESAIKKAITDKGHLIRLPASTVKRLRRMEPEARAVLTGTLVPTLSLDDVDEEGGEIGSRYPSDTNVEEPADVADAHDFTARLKPMLAALSKRERLVIIKRYGLCAKIYGNS